MKARALVKPAVLCSVAVVLFSASAALVSNATGIELSWFEFPDLVMYILIGLALTRYLDYQVGSAVLIVGVAALAEGFIGAPIRNTIHPRIFSDDSAATIALAVINAVLWVGVCVVCGWFGALLGPLGLPDAQTEPQEERTPAFSSAYVRAFRRPKAWRWFIAAGLYSAVASGFWHSETSIPGKITWTLFSFVAGVLGIAYAQVRAIKAVTRYLEARRSRDPRRAPFRLYLPDEPKHCFFGSEPAERRLFARQALEGPESRSGGLR
jgi:hypothetical protein